MERYHRSVLIREVLELLDVRAGGVYADLTFGEGGHTGALLEAGAARVVGLDRDPEALRLYRESGQYREDTRLELNYGRLSTFAQLNEAAAPGRRFDGILVDLGVSTRQLLRPERGFSFSQEGPLDMRMDAQGDADLLSRLSEVTAEELAEILERNADLKGARSLARRILERHREGKLTSTLDLAKLVGARPGPRHPATALFLALRMWVNRELDEVAEGLPALVELLKPGGRLAVISFHSTEDRAVKRTFLLLAGRCICEGVFCVCPRVERVTILTKKPITATREELRENPRSRSAKLRAVKRVTDSPDAH